MGCFPYYEQLKEVEKGLDALLRAGLGPATIPYETLYKMRGSILRKLGLKVPTPRLPSVLKLLALLSPGELKVFFDNEVGWVVEGRPTPESPPVIRRISHEEAVLLMGPEPPSDLVHKLLEPETYFGE